MKGIHDFNISHVIEHTVRNFRQLKAIRLMYLSSFFTSEACFLWFNLHEVRHGYSTIEHFVKQFAFPTMSSCSNLWYIYFINNHLPNNKNLVPPVRSERNDKLSITNELISWTSNNHQPSTSLIMELSKTNLELRIAILTERYDKFEQIYIDIIHNDEVLLNEFTDIQDRYFAVATSIKDTITASSGAQVIAVEGINGGENQTTRKIKLPNANIPKFDGSYQKWFSFKNTFEAMIHKREDLKNVEKLLYLRSSLTDKAANKISIFDDSPENYQRAWNFLRKA
ncbi:uncharacterized protein [Prorops nasuta]|uniref:uncharacterized protein n=1 Tax=Prorops nasuta TaxID=863751 RepID=UPI0034CF348F